MDPVRRIVIRLLISSQGAASCSEWEIGPGIRDQPGSRAKGRIPANVTPTGESNHFACVNQEKVKISARVILMLDASSRGVDKLLAGASRGPIRDSTKILARDTSPVRRLLMAVICPECDNPIDLDDELDQGETLQCDECGAELEVVSTDPVELAPVEEAGYDEEESSHLPGDEDE
jgi:alpha-aminoadipate/glutamate carrier protein LysW